MLLYHHRLWEWPNCTRDICPQDEKLEPGYNMVPPYSLEMNLSRKFSMHNSLKAGSLMKEKFSIHCTWKKHHLPQMFLLDTDSTFPWFQSLLASPNKLLGKWQTLGCIATPTYLCNCLTSLEEGCRETYKTVVVQKHFLGIAHYSSLVPFFFCKIKKQT